MTQPDSIPAEWIETLSLKLCALRCYSPPCKTCREASYTYQGKTPEEEMTWDGIEHRGVAFIEEAGDIITILRPLIEAETRERCAKLAEDFGWILPVLKGRKMNDATDDAACSVQQQIAAALRAEGMAKTA